MWSNFDVSFIVNFSTWCSADFKDLSVYFKCWFSPTQLNFTHFSAAGDAGLVDKDLTGLDFRSLKSNYTKCESPVFFSSYLFSFYNDVPKPCGVSPYSVWFSRFRELKMC